MGILKNSIGYGSSYLKKSTSVKAQRSPNKRLRLKNIAYGKKKSKNSSRA